MNDHERALLRCPVCERPAVEAIGPRRDVSFDRSPGSETDLEGLAGIARDLRCPNDHVFELVQILSSMKIVKGRQPVA